MKDVIIIGAGIAGLSAGVELHKNNVDFQVLETSSRVGGSIETINIDDCLIETGPQTFSSISKETLDLVKDLNIEDFLIEADSVSKKRFVYYNNKLNSVPVSLSDFIRTELLSKDAKMTLFEDLFIKKSGNEESVEEFFTRRFGREVLKNLIQPYLNGVYAGDVKKLSANSVFPKLKELEEKHNSIIVGFVLSQLSKLFQSPFKKLTVYSFKDGLGFLIKELHEKLKTKITLNVKDIEITRAKDFYIVNFKSNNKVINYTANTILFAIPAYKLINFSYLLPDVYINDYFNLEYEPIAVINQLVEKSNVKNNLNGFGYLCTKEPHRKLLGTIWASSIFPGRAPQGKALLTSYLGGAHYRKVAEQSEEEISSLVSKEVSDILEVSPPDSIKTLHIKIHPHAIPQYNLGHSDKVKRIEELMDTNAGLFFTGNYLYGISLNDTIKTSKITVERRKAFLKSIKSSPSKTEDSLSLSPIL